MIGRNSEAVRWTTGVMVVLACSLGVAGCGVGSQGSTSASASSTVVNGHNAADVSFLEEMVPHHEQAIVMADMVPSHSRNPELRALATSIKNAQGPEIATMSMWLDEWNEPIANEADGHNMMDMEHGSSQMPHSTGSGMMSNEQMMDLEDGKGAAFDRMWLIMMIDHHEGAIEMSQQELANGENARVKALARTIIAAQTKEITQMKAMLGQ